MNEVTKLIEEAQIKEGDFFTVARWKGISDRSYMRDCLEVKVIDLPLIRAYKHDVYQNGGMSPQPIPWHGLVYCVQTV